MVSSGTGGIFQLSSFEFEASENLSKNIQLYHSGNIFQFT
jgi:hypothetical protein